MMGKSMLEFGPNMRVMALCPHADDLELGCLATLLYLRLRYQAKINYVLFSKQWIDSRDVNAHKTLSRADECRKTAGILGATFDLVDHPFPDRRSSEFGVREFGGHNT